MASVRKRSWVTSKGESKTAWVLDWIDSRGGRQRRNFALKKDADRERVKVEGQLASGTYRPDADKYTVKDICENFLEYCEGRMRRDERMTQKTFVVYRGHVRNHILNDSYGITQTKLSHLTSKRVGEFRDAMREAGVSVVTARKILTSLHSILGYAISQDIVAVNAAHGVKVIGSRDEGAKKICPPTKEQMKTLIDVAPDALMKKMVFAASTGLRAGEQWGLRWRDVDFEKSELLVRQRVDAYGNVGAPKTSSSIRSVPLSEHMVAMLKRMKIASAYSKDDDYVFPNRDGGFTGHDNFIKRKYKPLFDTFDDMGRFNWHALRHFAISTWIESGLTPKTIQTFAGHSSLQVTMDRYGHMFKSDDHKKAMDGIATGLFN